MVEGVALHFVMNAPWIRLPCTIGKLVYLKLPLGLELPVACCFGIVERALNFRHLRRLAFTLPGSTLAAVSNVEETAG